MAVAAKTKKEWGHHWGAWVWVKWKHGAPENAWAKWKNIKEIKDVWSTTGKWDCALWVDASDPDEVERLVWREIRTNKWVEQTDTHWAKKYW